LSLTINPLRSLVQVVDLVQTVAMKKTLIYTFLSFLVFFSSQAQQWQWAYDEGGTGGADIECDGSGNIYVLAGVGYPVYGTYTLGCPPTECAIAKHDGSGNILWARGIAADGAAISLDKAGNIYITGSCSSGSFCGGNNPDISVVTQGTDLFLCKYNTNGDIQWVKTWGTSYAGEGGTAIRTDVFGNTYVAGLGNFYDFNLGGPQFNFLVLKYDSQGVLLWEKTSNWQGDMFATRMDVDYNGNCYITGQFSDSAYFDNISFISNSSKTIFIAKYNVNGDVVWAKKDGTGYDGSQSICLDRLGNFFITGCHSASSVFGNTTLPSGGVFIAKYDTSGTNIWAKSAKARMGNDVSVDTAGSCFFTGYFTTTGIFGNGMNSATLTTQKLNGEIFVAKYNKNGDFKWAVAPGGNYGGANQGNALCTDYSGNIFLTGMFTQITTFGNVSLNTQGEHIFLTKLKDSSAIITKVNETSTNQVELVVYPNPTGNFIGLMYNAVNKIDKLEVNVRNTNCQIIYSKKYYDPETKFYCEIDTQTYARGLYLIEINSDGKSLIKTIILN
jgi:hypothetical protein